MIHGDFNALVVDETLDTFCKSYFLNSPIKQRTCFKNPKNPSCIYLTLTQKPRSSQTKCVIDTGLSDFHRMTIRFENGLSKAFSSNHWLQGF